MQDFWPWLYVHAWCYVRCGVGRCEVGGEEHNAGVFCNILPSRMMSICMASLLSPAFGLISFSLATPQPSYFMFISSKVNISWDFKDYGAPQDLRNTLLLLQLSLLSFYFTRVSSCLSSLSPSPSYTTTGSSTISLSLSLSQYTNSVTELHSQTMVLQHLQIPQYHEVIK